jgi:drug/metabolite transporter (DMT)-like permease
MTAAPDALPPARQETALGILCLCVGIALFSVQDLILKLVSDRYPLSEVMAFRGAVALPILALLAARDGGLRSLVTPGTAAMIGRGAVMFFAYAGYCLALPALPIATTVALYFSAPLFITILSFFWLGDPVGWRRWLAVSIGFAGVLVMLRPGAALFDWAGLLALLSGLAYGLSMILARKLGRRETAPAMAFWGNAVFLAGALALALAFGDGRFDDGASHPTLGFLWRGWVWPTVVDGALMAGCGVIAALGLTLLTQAYRIADSTAVAPFEYSYILWALFWGWVFFAEWPDLPAWAGTGLILLAGLMVLWREKARALPPSFERIAADPESTER